jgi:Fe-S cluster biosynthesis and repair protein YggX
MSNITNKASKIIANENVFQNSLRVAKTEEDVKGAYAQFFGIKYNTSDRNDLYTQQVLFEFKYDKNLKQPKSLAVVLAQTLYYVRRLKFGGNADKPISPTLCIADKNEAVLSETSIWKDFYCNDSYDWDLAPSNPDEKLCKELANTDLLRKLHIYSISNSTEFQIFAQQLQKKLSGQTTLAFADKKIINETNFEEVFDYWNNIFGDSVRNGFKTSRYFVSDIQQGNTLFIPKESRAIFRVGQSGEMKEKKILPQDYEHFWEIYEKVSDMNVIRAILAKIDRLTDETMRRFHGEFFTPLKFAKKALDYIEKTIGANWWQSDNYRLWDMAAGTGNLEYYLPQEALKYCYLSTLYKEDVEHLNKLFPDAGVFQYDYLNDDIGNVFADKTLPFDITWKLPQKLRTDLKNPNIKWIILINPPFGTAQAGGAKGSNKATISDTQVRKQMHSKDLGEVSRELFSQFIYRIKYEFADKQAHLEKKKKIKYINSNNDQKLRDNVFDFGFEKGFVFSSVNFSGTSRTGQFPVGMLVWNINANKKLEEQHIELDVFNNYVEKTGTKIFKSIHKENFLSKWIKRPSAKITYPPLGSAIKIKSKNIDRRDRISENFLASLMCKGNDFQNQNFTALLSAPYVSAGALSVTPENFERAMVVHAARRIPKVTWLNDGDQFMAPNKELSAEFITDCTVWNLFASSNQTAALRDVEYEGKIYQIHNHFFPFTIDESKQWTIADNHIALQITTAKNTFVSEYLRKRALSKEAKEALNAGREIYKFYFENINKLRTPKFKIETYDAGWWQIRMALNEQHLAEELFTILKERHNLLRRKILPLLNEYDII